jgi:Ca2+-binding EF-hand superfamily protein
MVHSPQAIGDAAADAAATAITAKLSTMFKANIGGGDTKHAGGDDGAAFVDTSAIAFEPPSKLRDPRVAKLARTRVHTVAQLRRLNALFLRAAPDGDTDAAGFARVLKCVPGGSVDAYTALVVECFDDIDGVRDGVINFNAYLTILALASQGTEQQKLECLFHIYDDDGSGLLAGDEIERIALALALVAGDTFQGDTVREAMSMLGTNAIDSSTFVNYCLNDPSVAKLVEHGFIAVLKQPPTTASIDARCRRRPRWPNAGWSSSRRNGPMPRQRRRRRPSSKRSRGKWRLRGRR